MALPRMRTIDETMKYLREHDPGTSVTPSYLRTICRSGKLPTTKVGEKYLINLDVLEAFLYGKLTATAAADNE